MPDLPKSLRIGYRNYAIEEWDHKAAKAVARFGECDKNFGIIRVTNEYGNQQTAATLIHETLHAIWDHAGLPAKDEERIISAIANNLSQVWGDNPSWVEFISSSLAP